MRQKWRICPRRLTGQAVQSNCQGPHQSAFLRSSMALESQPRKQLAQRTLDWDELQQKSDSVSSSHDSTESRSALRAAAFGSASSAERLHPELPCESSPTKNGNQAASLEEDMTTVIGREVRENNSQVEQTTDKTRVSKDRPTRKRMSREERVAHAKESKAKAVTQTREALSKLEESLRQGKSDTLIKYLRVMGRFHRYSLRNLLLISAQNPNATHVAGFSAWQKLGRSVMIGEKGIRILARVKYKSKHDDVKNEKTENEEQVLAGFKCVSVFDVSQTEGEPLPEFSTAKGDPGRYLERLKKVVTEMGIKLEVTEIPGGALGILKGGSIQIAAGQTPEEEFATLAHETAHELMHKTPDRREKTKTVRETEAVAFAVCHAIGLDAESQSSDYIQLYQGDAELLQRSLTLIQETASWMIEAIKEIEEPHLARE